VALRSGDGVTWIGQNMDLGNFTDGHQVLLRLAPSQEELGALVFTVGSLIGLLGVNSRGVGVCVNSLPQLPSASEGLPVAFVVRKLLQAASVAAAARLIHELPHATGQHYLLADPTSGRSFEASPKGVVEYSPLEDSTRVLHTNHPLVADPEVPASERLLMNSVARLTSLRARLMSGTPTLEAIQAALSSRDDPDNPVCRVVTTAAGEGSYAGLINFTTGSMISALRQDASHISAWVSKGPPNLRGYAEFNLSTYR
jgi:isopenicillin-N N-acyltransferase-like protein